MHLGLNPLDPEARAIELADRSCGTPTPVRGLGKKAFHKHMTSLRIFHKICGHNGVYMDNGVSPRVGNPMFHPDVLVKPRAFSLLTCADSLC